MGDPSGQPRFKDFYLAQFHRVARAVYLVVEDAEEARDITQEAFARTWAEWDRFTGQPDPVGFTLRVAANLSRSHLRRVITLRRILPRLRARSQPVDEEAEVVLRMTVRRAVAGLPPRQQLALMLCDLLDYNSEEAGSILGISPSTARVHLARARATLAHALSDPQAGRGQPSGSPQRVERARSADD